MEKYLLILETINLPRDLITLILQYTSPWLDVLQALVYELRYLKIHSKRRIRRKVRLCKLILSSVGEIEQINFIEHQQLENKKWIINPGQLFPKIKGKPMSIHHDNDFPLELFREFTYPIDSLNFFWPFVIRRISFNTINAEYISSMQSKIVNMMKETPQIFDHQIYNKRCGGSISFFFGYRGRMGTEKLSVGVNTRFIKECERLFRIIN